MSRSAKKKSNASRLFLRSMLAFVFIYAVFHTISLRLQITERSQELARLEQVLEEQKLKNSELDDLLNADDQEQIEETARDKLGLVYPDERIYIDIS